MEPATYELMPSKTRANLELMASAHDTQEVCGFVMYHEGHWSIRKVTNVAKHREVDWKMRAEDQIETLTRYASQVVGLFHSHPGGRPDPSDADIASWPLGYRYWIVSRAGTGWFVREWIRSGEEAYCVDPAPSIC